MFTVKLRHWITLISVIKLSGLSWCDQKERGKCALRVCERSVECPPFSGSASCLSPYLCALSARRKPVAIFNQWFNYNQLNLIELIFFLIKKIFLRFFVEMGSVQCWRHAHWRHLHKKWNRKYDDVNCNRIKLDASRDVTSPLADWPRRRVVDIDWSPWLPRLSLVTSSSAQFHCHFITI